MAWDAATSSLSITQSLRAKGNFCRLHTAGKNAYIILQLLKLNGHDVVWIDSLDDSDMSIIDEASNMSRFDVVSCEPNFIFFKNNEKIMNGLIDITTKGATACDFVEKLMGVEGITVVKRAVWRICTARS